MFNIKAQVFKCFLLSAFQINEGFGKGIMYNDVTGCVVFKLNKIEYLEK